jgi:hypothetical protein
MFNEFRSKEFAEAIKPKVTLGPDLSWAEKIVAKYKAGQHVNYLPLKMAREALAKYRPIDDGVINVEVQETARRASK